MVSCLRLGAAQQFQEQIKRHAYQEDRVEESRVEESRGEGSRNQDALSLERAKLTLQAGSQLCTHNKMTHCSEGCIVIMLIIAS